MASINNIYSSRWQIYLCINQNCFVALTRRPLCIHMWYRYKGSVIRCKVKYSSCLIVTTETTLRSSVAAVQDLESNKTENAQPNGISNGMKNDDSAQTGIKIIQYFTDQSVRPKLCSTQQSEKSLKRMMKQPALLCILCNSPVMCIFSLLRSIVVELKATSQAGQAVMRTSG